MEIFVVIKYVISRTALLGTSSKVLAVFKEEEKAKDFCREDYKKEDKEVTSKFFIQYSVQKDILR